MMGGKAPMAMGIMWALTFVTWVFVVLRTYTRVVIVQQFGADDYIFVFSGVTHVAVLQYLQVSSQYGFGQPVAALQLDDAVMAVEYEMIGQTFAVIGMATAKVSLGLFLLRIVVKTWHMVLLWAVSIITLLVSMVVAVLFWTQCLPPRALYDPRVQGTCNFGIAPFSMLLGSTCIVADFFFAGFPWIIIWNLNMKYREKITIAASLSLGIVAGAAGIIRTVSLEGIASRNYTEDTVPLIVWSAVELAVTMICIGIPVLRPLYRRMRGLGSTDQSNSSNVKGYYKHDTGNDNQNGINLKNIPSGSESDTENTRGFPDAPTKLGIRGPTTVTYIRRDNHSDEEILGPEYLQSQSEGPVAGRIQVFEHVDVRVEQGKVRPGSQPSRHEETSVREVA
ncbi:hypothetical protein OQA88_788 [Cercophora sp. LCS_1]